MSTVNTRNMSTDEPNEEKLTFLYYSKEMTLWALLSGFGF